MTLVDVVLRDEPLDGAVARDLLAAFASEIASPYPGWHPGAGPSADPGEFVACGEIKRLSAAPGARQSGNEFASHCLEKFLQ
jgi:hypothetical protein